MQEVIPGPDDANWVCGCTFNQAHELLDCAIKQKLRMAPAHFGVSSFAVSVSNPTIRDLACRIGKALKFSGHASIEFHWDHRDGTYKYLELNPRIPLTVEFDDFCGLPTAWNTYQASLDGDAPFQPGTQRDGLLYLDLMDDLKARLADGERFWAIVADYLRLLPRKTGGVYFTWDDPVPGLWITWRIMKAGIRRLARRGQDPPPPGGAAA